MNIEGAHIGITGGAGIMEVRGYLISGGDSDESIHFI
jgi:hypothetical protein